MQYEVAGDDYIAVSFNEIEAFLGREHNGSSEDDEAIIAELLNAGAPDWIETNEGFIDNDGRNSWWCIKGPSFDRPYPED